jgi:hypothetical protein
MSIWIIVKHKPFTAVLHIDINRWQHRPFQSGTISQHSAVYKSLQTVHSHIVNPTSCHSKRRHCADWDTPKNASTTKPTNNSVTTVSYWTLWIHQHVSDYTAFTARQRHTSIVHHHRWGENCWLAPLIRPNLTSLRLSVPKLLSLYQLITILPSHIDRFSTPR